MDTGRARHPARPRWPCREAAQCIKCTIGTWRRHAAVLPQSTRLCCPPQPQWPCGPGHSKRARILVWQASTLRSTPYGKHAGLKLSSSTVVTNNPSPAHAQHSAAPPTTCRRSFQAAHLKLSRDTESLSTSSKKAASAGAMGVVSTDGSMNSSLHRRQVGATSQWISNGPMGRQCQQSKDWVLGDKCSDGGQALHPAQERYCRYSGTNTPGMTTAYGSPPGKPGRTLPHLLGNGPANA